MSTMPDPGDAGQQTDPSDPPERRERSAALNATAEEAHQGFRLGVSLLCAGVPRR